MAGPRGRARRHRARARPAGHLRGLGGLRGPRRPARRLPARPATSSTRSSATPTTPGPACTATSARAACTPGSRSTCTPPRAWPRTAGSWNAPPTWSCATAARCPASTATASPAASCCRMFGDEVVRAVRRASRTLFDPDDRMNPGKVVRPAPARRAPAAGGDWAPAAPRSDLFFGYPDDGGSFAQAANRCVGRRQVPPARARRRHGDVPVLPGHPARRSTPPGAGPGCCSRCSTATATRPITDGWRSTEVARRARPVPGLQGLQDRLPGQRGHGDVQGRVPGPPLPATGCGPAPTTPLGWLPVRPRRSTGSGWPGRSTRLSHDPAAAPARHADRRPRGPRDARVRRRTRCSAGTPGAAPARHGPRGGTGAAVAGHVHQPLPPARRAGRGPGARRRRLAGARSRPSRCAAG